ncbi:hypothetical protein FQZ97_860090 [compost metagenome]
MFDGPIRFGHQRHGPAEHLPNVGSQGSRRGCGPAPDEAQRLLTETTTLPFVQTNPQLPGQLRVVAQLRMTVQRQVIGIQIDIVGQQARQTLLHPARDPPILPAPEQSVMHENGIGPGTHSRVNQRPAGRHASDQFPDVASSLHLQPIGAIVAKQRRLQQGVQRAQQHLSRYGGRWQRICRVRRY